MELISETIIPYTLIKNTYEDFDCTYHSHHPMEIVYSLKGLATIYFTDHDGNNTRVFIKSNQFAIVRPNVNHRMKYQGQMINIELAHRNKELPLTSWLLKNEFVQNVPTACKLLENNDNCIVFNDTQNIADLLNEFLSLVYDHQHGTLSPFYDVEYDTLLRRLLIKICQCNRLLIDKIPSNKYLTAALMFISENYARNINVSDIANYVKISAVYLQKLFKQAYNKTVLSVLTNQRLLAARDLLLNTNMNIASIAMKVGYSNSRSFQIAFKNFYGDTPYQYRKLNLNDSFIVYRDYENINKTADIKQKQFMDIGEMSN